MAGTKAVPAKENCFEMKTPFEVLGVEETAGDAVIKSAYLQKVREHPPEREPERFQEVRAAFEAIETHRKRLAYELFHNDPPDPRALLERCLEGGEPGRPSEELFRRVLADTLRGAGV
jgi:curved DNA-binding protein CbpA